ncbi:MAG: hypothetical protein ACREQV_15945, partial [Candidatus Binatia bacterium]
SYADFKALFDTVYIPAPTPNSPPIAAVEFSCIDHYWLSPDDAMNRSLEGKGYDAGKKGTYVAMHSRAPDCMKLLGALRQSSGRTDK